MGVFQRGILVWWKEKRMLAARDLSLNTGPATACCMTLGTASSDPS